ncbi:expressed unknown protein [Seminavis robusta]|uniref:Uncharacterized protein n=1 Tax=Seminavis robusta TaxID=568900 RepID=A0A9N8EPS5_9STRA|nr:expressed unknown protein [Seminavis robusta]|eukprot:Sro1394_g268950.1 n/a (499) ;mRNA; f:17396-18892
MTPRQDDEGAGAEQPFQPQRPASPSASDEAIPPPSLSRNSTSSGISVAVGLPVFPCEQDDAAMAAAMAAALPLDLQISPDDCLPLDLDQDELALNLAGAALFASYEDYIPPVDAFPTASTDEDYNMYYDVYQEQQQQEQLQPHSSTYKDDLAWNLMNSPYYEGCDSPPPENDELAWNLIRQLRMVLLTFSSSQEREGTRSYYRMTPAEVNDEMFLTRARSLVQLCRERGGHAKVDLAVRHKGASITEGWVYVRHMLTSSRQPGLKVRAPGALSLIKFTVHQEDQDTWDLMQCLQDTMEQIQAVMVEALSDHCEVLPLMSTEELWTRGNQMPEVSGAGSELRLAVERAECWKRNRLEEEDEVLSEEEEEEDDLKDSRKMDEDSHAETADNTSYFADSDESVDFEEEEEVSCALTAVSDDSSEEPWSPKKEEPKAMKDEEGVPRRVVAPAPSTRRRRQRFSIVNAVCNASLRFARAVGYARRTQARSSRRLDYNSKGDLC